MMLDEPMRYADLLEAPIEMHVNDYRSSDEQGSFRDDDVAIMQSDKAQAKIASIWRNSVVDVVVYLLNITTRDRTGLLRFAIDNSRFLSPRSAREIGTSPRKDAITVVLTQNEGNERLPLTGWMLAHRLYHAIELAARGDRRNTPIKRKLDALYNYLSSITRLVIRTYSDTPDEDFGHRCWISGSTMMQMIGTTRAARNRNMANNQELMPEAFAQYLLTGKVRFGEFVPDVETNRGPRQARADLVAALNTKLREGEALFTDVFQYILRYATGKVVRL